MAPKTIISNLQLVLLISLANISTTVLFIPVEPVTIVKQDAWIAVFLAAVTAAPLLFFALADLTARYPGKSMIQYSESILGKYLGKIIGAVFVYYFFQIHCWTLREFGEMALIFFPETPMLAFIIIISFLTVFAVYNGLEVIARTAEFTFPLGIISLVFIFLAGITRMDTSNIFPVLESGILPIIRAAVSPLEWLSNGFVFGAIAVYAKNQNELKKTGFIIAALSGTILLGFSLINITVLGTSIIAITNFPLLEMAKQVKFPSFERLELLVILFWIPWIFIRSSLFSYVTVSGLSQLFNLKDFKFLIISETTLAIAYSVFQYANFTELSYLFGVAHIFYLSTNFGLPLFLWTASLIRSALR